MSFLAPEGTEMSGKLGFRGLRDPTVGCQIDRMDQPVDLRPVSCLCVARMFNPLLEIALILPLFGCPECPGSQVAWSKRPTSADL